MKLGEIINEKGVNWEKVNTIPEFIALSKTPQSERWHQEGNVLTHTKLVVKEIIRSLKSIESDDKTYYLIMMASALCHDLGKAVTTRWDDEKKDYTCPNHGYEGDKIVRKLFFDEDIIVREKVCFMVRWHMTLHHLPDKAQVEQYKIIASLGYGLMKPVDLLTLTKCDAKGSINEESLDKNFLDDKFNKIAPMIYHTTFKIINDAHRNEQNIDKLSYLSDVSRPSSKRKPFNVTLMIGVAGAGKDTWITNHLPDDIMLSRDNIRTEIGIKGEKPFGTKQQENKVTEIFNSRLIDYCEKKRDVIINNTNLLRKYRDEFIKMILPYDPFITFVYIEPNKMSDCAKRREGQIKKEIVDGMWNRLDFPDNSECDRLVIVKQDEDGNYTSKEFNNYDAEIVYQ